MTSFSGNAKISSGQIDSTRGLHMDNIQQEKVIVIDFGGQYNQLVARRVRECQVYCEIYSYRTALEKVKEMNPKGIILTGGPNSVYQEGAATAPKGPRTVLRGSAHDARPGRQGGTRSGARIRQDKGHP